MGSGSGDIFFNPLSCSGVSWMVHPMDRNDGHILLYKKNKTTEDKQILLCVIQVSGRRVSSIYLEMATLTPCYLTEIATVDF